jgi:hypothetical protein
MLQRPSFIRRDKPMVPDYRGPAYFAETAYEDESRRQAQRERADRNFAWWQSQPSELWFQHRGKCYCVAGEQLFVADTPEEAQALAQAAHPNDDGIIHGRAELIGNKILTPFFKGPIPHEVEIEMPEDELPS